VGGRIRVVSRLAALVQHLGLGAGHDHLASLRDNTAIEARVASTLERILLVVVRRLGLHRVAIATDGHANWGRLGALSR
jgi:hypothetical protein